MNIASKPIFEIFISLTLIYALLSILVSILLEWLNHYMDERSKMLKQSIHKLLKDDNNLNYGELFYNHFNIQAITKTRPRRHYFFLLENKKASPKKSFPSYVSSSMFADVLIDIIGAQSQHLQEVQLKRDESGNILKQNGNKVFEAIGDPVVTGVMAKYKAGVNSMKPSPFKDLLTSFHEQVPNGDNTKLKTQIENWFNDYQERVTGWYKKKQRKKGLIVGLIVALLLNVDTLHLAKVLSLDENFRANMVKQAEVVADNYEALDDSLKSNVDHLIKTFATNDTIKKEINSISKGGNISLVDSISILTKYLESKNLPELSRTIDSLKFLDDYSKEKLKSANQIRAIASSLNIPIGYNWSSAPLSWRKSYVPTENKDVKNADNGLYEYNQARNKGGNVSLVFKYFIGLIISGIALSFGAPFWFEFLVKFVNIRRSGLKPEVKKETK